MNNLKILKTLYIKENMMVPEEINIIASSNPLLGAVNRSSDGSYFEIQLDEALQIPRDALNVTLAVEDSSIWWVVPNIITGNNDKMYISGPDTADVIQNYVITIPQGLYDLAGLNSAILRELDNQDAKIDPNPLFIFSPDENTQKVELRVNYDTVEIDFTQADTPRIILGFDSQVLGPYPSAPETILAENIAQFNQVNYFLIHSDLTNRGIRINNSYSQTISQVLIDVSPGSQIVNKPYNPSKINVQDLAGAKRSNIRMWLTDDSQRRVNTNFEYWTARLVIRYLRPFILTSQR